MGDRTLDEPATRTFVPPEDRRVAVVHQDFVLFPHLRVLDNVAFGPRSAGVPRRRADQVAREWLERMDLGDYALDRPASLSGGQAQRVALARALAADPEVLLLDEPLSALDVTTRATTRRDLRHHLDAFAGATVVVTHDPLDALLLAGRVAVLEAGRVTQAGSVAELTSHPRTRYVADLIGTNLLRGVADGLVGPLRRGRRGRGPSRRRARSWSRSRPGPSPCTSVGPRAAPATCGPAPSPPSTCSASASAST